MLGARADEALDQNARTEAARFSSIERGCLKDLGTNHRLRALDLTTFVKTSLILSAPARGESAPAIAECLSGGQ